MTSIRKTLAFAMTFAIVLSCISNTQAASPLHKRIDKAISDKAKGPYAGISSDAEFLRRVYLDLVGMIPEASVVRAFLNDKTKDKRATLIDRLLASPDHAGRMTHALTVMLLERREGKTISDADWRSYVVSSFAVNRPWDEFVAELIAADGRDKATRPAMRFFIDGGRTDLHQMTTDVARLFLGVDLQCARCHDHPNIEDYKQADYFGLYAYLRQSKLHSDKKLKHPLFVETAATGKSDFLSVFEPTIKRATGPRLASGKEIEVPKFEKGEEFAEVAKDGQPAIPKFRPRQLLSSHLTSPKNRQFVLNSVNRFWFLMMGRGLVHPLDLHHSQNPASHPELLNLLADDFVAHKFDIKYLLREIALSESYQRSSLLPDGVNAKDVKPQSYRVANAKPLSAEQLLFGILSATGNLEKWTKPTGLLKEKSKFTYKDYINGRIPPPKNVLDTLKLFTATFGNPPGEAEVEFAPSMSHSLFLTNEKLIAQWLQPAPGNLIERLAKLKEPSSIAEELYLSILSRLPEEVELAEVASHLADHKNRRIGALSDLASALLSSAEFRLNH